MNSDMNAGPEEQTTAFVQVGRFSGLCRVYAPIYRQIMQRGWHPERRAFVQHFESGGTLLDFNPPDYKEFIKAQKQMWDSRTKRSSADAQTSHPGS